MAELKSGDRVRFTHSNCYYGRLGILVRPHRIYELDGTHVDGWLVDLGREFTIAYPGWLEPDPQGGEPR